MSSAMATDVNNTGSCRRERAGRCRPHRLGSRRGATQAF
jgi:hypothetical protein